MRQLRAVWVWLASIGLAAPASAERPVFSVVDLHVDLPYQLGSHAKPLREGTGQAALPKLAAGGVGGVVLPLFIPRDVAPGGPRAIDLEQSYLRVLRELQQGGGLSGSRLWVSGRDAYLAGFRRRRASGRRTDQPGCVGGSWRAPAGTGAH
jgi:hypothetical protein